MPIAFRPATRSDLSTVAWLAAGAAASVVLALKGVPGLIGGCPFHRALGLPCPTCGTTRALEALLAGRWLPALALNPLAAIALVLGAIALLIAPLWVLRGWPVPSAREPWPRSIRLGLLAIVLANWAYLVVRDGGR